VQTKKYEVVEGSHRPGVLQLLVQQVGILIVIVFLALGLVLGAIILLPEATVTLTPVSQPLETELIVKADPAVDSVNFAELVFPARVDQVELELFAEIETVDTRLAPVGQGAGSVVFINRTEAEQTIPMSTTLANSFILTKLCRVLLR